MLRSLMPAAGGFSAGEHLITIMYIGGKYLISYYNIVVSMSMVNNYTCDY